MVKNKYSIIFICLMLLLSLSAENAMAEEYIKNVAIGDTSIKFDQSEFPPVAYLYMKLKNNGDKNISNLTLEITYYDSEGYLIKKSAVKNALTGAMPKGEERKYKIRLSGDIVDTEHEQYPYSQQDKVNGFDVKITGIKFGSR